MIRLAALLIALSTAPAAAQQAMCAGGADVRVELAKQGYLLHSTGTMDTGQPISVWVKGEGDFVVLTENPDGVMCLRARGTGWGKPGVPA
jgi:hypothetical protein